MVLKEAELFSMTWNMVDAVLKQMSMRAFVDEIQTHLAKIFQCDRVNIMLVDRAKRRLFRLKQEKRRR
jgi:uncharacterized protein YigA (DUF484 family)